MADDILSRFMAAEPSQPQPENQGVFARLMAGGGSSSAAGQPAGAYQTMMSFLEGAHDKIVPEPNLRDTIFGAMGMIPAGRAAPMASGVIRGVYFKGPQAHLDQLMAARKAGASSAEIQSLADGLSGAAAKQATPSAPSNASPSNPGTLQDRIVEAYAKATGGKFNTSAPIASIRSELPDVPRADVDAALMDMQRKEVGSLMQNDVPSWRTQADIDGALMIGKEPRHILWISKDPRAK